MSRFMHPFIAPLLAIILALTGHSVSVARGASAATGQMVLCVGADVVTVYVDAEGQPTSAPHICPDCAFTGLLADLDKRILSVVPAGFSSVRHGTQRIEHRGRNIALAYASRAPPMHL